MATYLARLNFYMYNYILLQIYYMIFREILFAYDKFHILFQVTFHYFLFSTNNLIAII